VFLENRADVFLQIVPTFFQKPPRHAESQKNKAGSNPLAVQSRHRETMPAPSQSRRDAAPFTPVHLPLIFPLASSSS
jgi:hypothetical protein